METTQSKSNGRLIAIIAMFFIFAMISFVTNLAAPIGTIWGNEFEGNSVLGMMGNMMNFLAYLFMGIPAGNLLVKIGYKKTALWAMAVGVIGLFVQYLSGVIGTDTSLFSMTSSIDEGKKLVALVAAATEKVEHGVYDCVKHAHAETADECSEQIYEEVQANYKFLCYHLSAFIDA